MPVAHRQNASRIVVVLAFSLLQIQNVVVAAHVAALSLINQYLA